MTIKIAAQIADLISTEGTLRLLTTFDNHPSVSSRIFDLLNSMIHDVKRSVDLRLLFDAVLYASLDGLVFWHSCLSKSY